MSEELSSEGIRSKIITLRARAVMLDADLAFLYGTETKKLNQQVKRNIERFPDMFAFQLTRDEFAGLKSQSVTASSKHGGRRTPPWAFTEHGVAMAATVLTSPRAVQVLHLIIEVFVDTRQQMLSGAAAKETGKYRKRLASIHQKLEKFSEAILDVEINKRDHTTVRQEAEALTTSVLDAVKAHLADKQVRNEEVIAEIHRKMAEADKLRAEARKVHAEADALDIKNLRDRFELMTSIVATLAESDPQPLLTAMDELGLPAPVGRIEILPPRKGTE
ncbi:ORF6N domain-containing protein [Rhizobium ruizarguesonis]|uniref:ORF6N domain-containing protein n=1 Tax=Rhizobium ruizarguesonis TaxID=2081791 RepID=UPI001038620E|nr:ORF6N domain-containing protein [Rhizobium ruizarguesonis]TBB32455.1 ORF6N domain-containing protein [Rhizobium ruizarguesonis]